MGMRSTVIGWRMMGRLDVFGGTGLNIINRPNCGGDWGLITGSRNMFVSTPEPTVSSWTGLGLFLGCSLGECQLVRVLSFGQMEATEVVESVDGQGQSLCPS